MSLKQKLDSILDKWTLSDTGLPMICAGVVTKDGTIIYEGAAGVNDSSKPENKTTLDTTFEIYSTTKAITTTAAVQLIEQGKIGLDDLVEDYVPEVKDVKLLEGFDEKDDPIYKDVVNKPTIRNLMTHTAGFSYPFTSKKHAKLLKKTGFPNPFHDTWKDVLGPYVFEPGTKWHYGTNIDVLGKVVENVTGEKLEQYFKKNIFEPCGIESFTFYRTPEQQKNKAIIHGRNSDGTFTVLPEQRPLVPLFNCGGHGIYGDVGDYLKFVSIFLNKGTSPITGKQVLKPESVEKYSFANLAPEGVTFGDTLEVSVPELATSTTLFNLIPQDSQGWTSSFFKTGETLPTTGRSAGSYTWSGLPNLYYWIDPIVGVAGMFATQIFPLFDKTAWDANDEFEAAVYEYLKE